MDKDKKNIGIFTYDFWPFVGGQGKHFYEIYKNLKNNNNFTLYVFSPRENNLKNHIRIFPETSKKKYRNIEFSVKLNLKIKEIIKKYNLAVAHFNGGPGGVILFREIGIPVVYTANHTYYQQYKLVPQQKWKWIFSGLESRGYSLSNKIISISETTSTILTDKFDISPSKITVIPLGVSKSD